MGGAFISIGFVHSFNQNMTAGRGFIALAVVIVGKWRPVPRSRPRYVRLLAGARAAAPGVWENSSTLLQALPYVVT